VQGKVDANRLIFIDETWAKTNMTRTHGRCAVGQRLVHKVPHGHWKTLTFVAGLRCDGLIAPCVLDRPINAISFLAWVTQFLVPTLRRDDVVIMDNLSSHKAAAVRRAIKAAGAKLFFLPPYSPDLNPIEQAFSQLKTLLRKENARTFAHTTTCIGKLLDQVTPKACANYFKTAGYSAPQEAEAAQLEAITLYFGEPRSRGSHFIYKMPWPMDPRVNLQRTRDGKAKPYQIKQLITAIDHLASLG
jgi:transposase